MTHPRKEIPMNEQENQPQTRLVPPAAEQPPGEPHVVGPISGPYVA